MFDKCAQLNMHASKPVWAGYVSSLYILCKIYSCVVLYKMFTLLLIKYTYIHIYIHTYIHTYIQTYKHTYIHK